MQEPSATNRQLLDRPLIKRLRYATRASVGPKVKKLRDRIDDKDVRNARRLVRALRGQYPPDVIAFGDSNWVFRAPYDVDERTLPAMVSACLGPSVSMYVAANAGYYSTVMRAFVRLVELADATPVIVVPLCARLCSVAWSTHPRYTYANAISVINGFDGRTPLWRMHAGFPSTSPADFAQYGSTVISTWAGRMTIDEIRAPILSPDRYALNETERRRLLYAYHHGETIHEGQASLLEIQLLAESLKALNTEVVVFETPVPVDEGVRLWGGQFRENATNSFKLMRKAFRQGYDRPVEILTTGLRFERSEFIDPADGSEHLNEHGRHRMAELLSDAIRVALDRRTCG